MTGFWSRRGAVTGADWGVGGGYVPVLTLPPEEDLARSAAASPVLFEEVLLLV